MHYPAIFYTVLSLLIFYPHHAQSRDANPKSALVAVKTMLTSEQNFSSSMAFMKAWHCGVSMWAFWTSSEAYLGRASQHNCDV
jgi:hypothetical protein